MRVMSAPYYVAWNFNYACNFNCSHCYSRARWFPEELTTEQYLSIADDMADLGVFRVALGGGEPLLRSDCTDVVARLAQRGVEAHMTTNAWNLDRAWATRLRESGLSRLYISLDSSNELQHDAFRRHAGSYARVLMGAKVALEAGLEVFFSTVIVRQNISQLSSIASIARSIGIAGVEFKRFRPAGNGAERESEFGLNASDEIEMLAGVNRIRHDPGLSTVLVNGPGTSLGEQDSVGCGCGVRSLCLRPNGDVSPCAYSELVIGNLCDTSLKQLWTTSPELVRMRSEGGCQASAAIGAPSNPLTSLYRSRREARGR